MPRQSRTQEVEGAIAVMEGSVRGGMVDLRLGSHSRQRRNDSDGRGGELQLHLVLEYHIRMGLNTPTCQPAASQEQYAIRPMAGPRIDKVADDVWYSQFTGMSSGNDAMVTRYFFPASTEPWQGTWQLSDQKPCPVQLDQRDTRTLELRNIMMAVIGKPM
nr:hypothetical protein CFP56_67704 [Quercus suber]